MYLLGFCAHFVLRARLSRAMDRGLPQAAQARARPRLGQRSGARLASGFAIVGGLDDAMIVARPTVADIDAAASA